MFCRFRLLGSTATKTEQLTLKQSRGTNARINNRLETIPLTHPPLPGHQLLRHSQFCRRRDLKFKTLVPLQSPPTPIERGSSEAGKSGTIPSDVGPESSLKLFSESYEEAFRKSAKSGHSPNWDASWISDSNTKPRSTSSPPAFPQGTGQGSRINQEHRQARGRGGRGRNSRGGRGWDQGYRRGVSGSKYAARSAHFQDTKRTNECTIASEGGLRNTSRKSSDSSSKRFERNGKTHTRESGATSRDTNSSDSSMRSERGESSIGSVNSNGSGA
ncbi:unnamed protein product, partial [Porites lobata]